MNGFYHIPDEDLLLRGRIDRMDLYETEDKLYVRVIDYKPELRPLIFRVYMDHQSN